ncbi:MAG: DUF711 family protein [Anaerolineae bacterium]|nr:MAG: DUF711 family protein [Anaerolineae bacterium]
MKIRSITYFINPRWPLDEARMAVAGAFIAVARPAYEAAGYEVQTTRMATVPFADLLGAWNLEEAIRLAVALGAASTEQGYNYLALGPARIGQPQACAAISEILKATANTFLCAEMSTQRHGISLPAVRACAQVIHELASLDPNGFGNMYFTALANVPPGSPFFPAAYHEGDAPAFAIATEAADLAVTAFEQAGSLAEAVGNLVGALEQHGAALAAVGAELEKETGARFGGIDFSLAAFPAESQSLGTAFERLGVPAVGRHGSLAAAAILADSIDRAQFPRAGFSGLMLPVLEDYKLAQRAAEGHLTAKDMLMFSAVCGTGLDTLPLPGDTTPEQLAALLLDLAALAQRLDKPLTARLMPIPGKQAGELTTFDFDFFANSRVLALDAAPLSGPLTGDESFELKPRPKRAS